MDMSWGTGKTSTCLRVEFLDRGPRSGDLVSFGVAGGDEALKG